MGERNCRMKAEIKGCAIKWRKFELFSLVGFGEVDSRNDDGGNERVTLLLLSL